MTNDQFEALVGRLERQAQVNPRGYVARVLLLAALGNAYIVAMLVLVLALLVGLLLSVLVLKALAIKLIFVVGFFLWMVVKALWVKIDPPVGMEVDARQAPELFAELEALRRKLGALRFHHVLITDEFNAGVVQSPRLGIFGWPRNYLLIGLPLMKALTVDQFKAVLAHELGHLAGGHGRVSNWIYRQRLRWSRLWAILDASASRGSFLFMPFLNRFVPYFNAYTFPMARANEYQADAASARLTSAKTAAEALTGVNVVGSFLAEKYWPHIHRQADEQPQPGFAPYFGIGHGVAQELDAASAETWLQQAMARTTDSADTHPALGDRLQAIGQAPCLALPGLGQTADRLLGDALESITEGFDRRWRESIGPSWQERYQAVQEGRRQLAELNARCEAGEELTVDEAYDRARLTESMADHPDDALAQLRALHERAPDNALVCFTLGTRLVGRDDADGCGLLEKSMALDESATAKVCELLRDYCWRQDRKDEAEVWHQRLAERLQLENAAARERNQVLLADKFERHELPEAVLGELCAELRKVPGLRKAYLVRKRVKHFAHLPCYVLGYKTSRWFQPLRKRRVADVMAQIQATVRFPGETLIINVEGDNYRFGRKLAWMRGARIL